MQPDVEMIDVGSDSDNPPDVADRQRLGNQVAEVSDGLKNAAAGAGSDLPPQQLLSREERIVRAQEELVRGDISKQIDHGIKDLQSVVDFVRSVSGLTVSLISYPDNTLSLLEDLKPCTAEVASQASEVALEAPGVFRAHVALREGSDPCPLAVAVYGVDEANIIQGAWGYSDFIVFRRVSAIADQALSYFRGQATERGEPSTSILLHLLLWLCSYRNLFSEQCSVLESILASDTASQSLIPPVYRRFRQSTNELVQAAKTCKAYHLHLVPQELL